MPTMKSSNRRPFEPFLLCTMLLGATVAQGCASKANPVLPSTGDPAGGGLASGASEDGGAAADVAATSDAQEVAVAGTNSDASFILCDLLKQDCPGESLGCYPFSGVGRCFPRGGEGVGGSCGFGESPTTPLCDRGLTCITTSDMGGTCLLFCDPSNPAAVCGQGIACLQRVPGIPTTSNVGYCPLLP